MHFEIGKQLTPKNGIIVFIVLIVIGGFYIINWAQVKTITATVMDVDTIHETNRTTTSSGKTRRTTTSRHIIQTDKGEFEDKSDILRGKMGMQYYYTVKEGKTYIFTTSGNSLPFIRIYPNIIDLKEVTATTSPETNAAY